MKSFHDHLPFQRHIVCPYATFIVEELYVERTSRDVKKNSMNHYCSARINVHYDSLLLQATRGKRGRHTRGNCRGQRRVSILGANGCDPANPRLDQRASTICNLTMATHNDQLNVGTFTPSLLIDLARSSGALGRVGLDVNESQVPSSPAQFTSLEAGGLDVVFTSPDNVVAYHFLTANPLRRGIPLQIISAIDRGLGLSLCTAPHISNVEDLYGQVLAVDVSQSGFAFVAYALLEMAGLFPGDYIIESLGSTPKRADALIAGSCAATILNAGNELRAVGAGCSNLSPVSNLGPYLGTVLATLADRDESANEVNRRFVDALRETIHEIVAGDREDNVIESAMRLLNLTEEEAKEHYACLRNPTTGFVESGRVDRASIETLVTLRHTYAPTPELNGILSAIDSVLLEKALE